MQVVGLGLGFGIVGVCVGVEFVCVVGVVGVVGVADLVEVLGVISFL